MIQTIQLAWRVFRFLLDREKKNIFYGTITRNGIPTATVVVATGREAWRVSDLAMQASATRAGVISCLMQPPPTR